MFTACSKNDIEQVKMYLAQGESANKLNEQPFFEQGWTPIRYASLAGNKNDSEERISAIIEKAKKIISLLIENGGDINHRDADGATTLMSVAPFKRRIPLVQFMIENGADKTLKDQLGKTAHEYATTEEMSKILKY